MRRRLAADGSDEERVDVRRYRQAHQTSPPYEVVGDWADLSGVAGATSCWVHNAIVATDGGEIICFHAGQLVAFDPDGRLLRVVETGLTEGHGITLVREGDAEYPLG